MSGPPLIPTAEAVEPALTPINSITTSSPAIKNNDLGSVKQNASSNTKTFSEAVGNSSVVAASAKFSVVHHHEEAEQAAPPTLAETNPTAVVNKIFKEIDDGYYLEVLPANKGNMITIPIEHTNDLCLSVPSGRPGCGNVNSIILDAEADDLDWQKYFPRSKRRGRPPGSKNKSPSGIGGDEASLQNSIKYTSGSSDLNSVPTENNLG
ncbi:hypothetical protein SUGI_0834600 [Cryptomeria japonica]|nr:hypothetical protein SUGI_0834600 [Cryptomeria japonica]